MPSTPSDSIVRCGSSGSGPLQPGLVTMLWMTTSLPFSSIPAPSQPRIRGSWSGRSPTPLSDDKSCRFRLLVRMVMMLQPSFGSGSGRSPICRPARGSVDDNDTALTANMPATLVHWFAGSPRPAEGAAASIWRARPGGRRHRGHCSGWVRHRSP
ncbi:hypothetical protein SDC9_137064 [bioreactor metagenome]|uniref:Uncharacterized protein n=1 Tax=bioreactor metagenome TaxID=1076179 RepID=A0A645DKX9_9ZZZZ